jgi:hypothetical protein
VCPAYIQEARFLKVKLQTPVTNQPEESIKHSENGESLESKIKILNKFYF